MVIHSPGPVCGPPGATHCWQRAGGQCNLYKQRTSRIKKNVDDRLMQTHDVTVSLSVDNFTYQSTGSAWPKAYLSYIIKAMKIEKPSFFSSYLLFSCLI